MDKKPLRVACAEAEGWNGCHEVLPPYGESTAKGHALTVELMQVQPLHRS